MTHHYILKIRVWALLALMLLIGNYSVFAQQTEGSATQKIDFKLHEKGKYYVTWGYNRSMYEKSDIHFTGQGHDFIIYNVDANDRPSELNLDYVTPTKWSIPQFNFRVGYFLSDKYSISAGWDHMKYVAVNYQPLVMYGYLNPTQVPDPTMQANMTTMNNTYSPDGLYNNETVIMDPATFLSYEHTDGFNYATVDLDRYTELWQLKQYDKLGVTLVTGAGLGVIVPRTDARLFGSGRNHFWNLAGWGTNAKIGVQINLLKNVYLQSDLKMGYVKMLNVHTTNYYNIDRAQQNVVFYENSWLIGFCF